jgi:hypothetical protein
VAGAAEKTVVLQPALAAAISDRNNVIGLPSWPSVPPRAAGRTIAGRRFRSRPLTMSLYDVEAANLAHPLVAFLDLLTHVPGAASNLPFVHAGVAAESPPGGGNRAAAPAANRFPGVVAVGLTPLFGGHHPRAMSAHDAGYRAERQASLAAHEDSVPFSSHSAPPLVFANL